MQLVNATRMQAAWTGGTDKTGREHVVVVVKGTFLIPDDGGTATLAPPEAQVAPVMADTFTGAPGFSAPVDEADFPLRKPRCDVLLKASAHAPDGGSVARLKAGVRLGAWQKVVEVVGDRVWRPAGATLGPSAAAPFTTMPLTYDRAFGGVDDSDLDAADAYRSNPVGRGHGVVRSGERLIGRPLPNIEAPGEPVEVPWGAYRPIALGPLGRGWQPRLAFAGTYDQAWIDHVFPFLPADFDQRYFQAAPADQQIEPPAGGTPVVLVNLTPEGRTGFRLPTIEMPVVFVPRHGRKEATDAVLDTVVIEPDARRMTLTWRSSRPVRRDLFEVVETIAGSMSRGWWRAHDLGKPLYSGLGALSEARRLGRLQ